MVPSRINHLSPSITGAPDTSRYDDNHNTTLEKDYTSEHLKRSIARLWARADCTTVRVEDGDICDSLATKCGVSVEDFLAIHPSPTFCDSLLPDDIVCCDEGDIPKPPANADGTCRDIKVQESDTCTTLAGECGIPIGQLQEFNGNDRDFCSPTKLTEGIWVCCTLGSLPVHSPKAKADGSCVTHTLTATSSAGLLRRSTKPLPRSS